MVKHAFNVTNQAVFKPLEKQPLFNVPSNSKQQKQQQKQQRGHIGAGMDEFMLQTLHESVIDVTNKGLQAADLGQARAKALEIKAALNTEMTATLTGEKVHRINSAINIATEYIVQLYIAVMYGRLGADLNEKPSFCKELCKLLIEILVGDSTRASSLHDLIFAFTELCAYPFCETTNEIRYVRGAWKDWVQDRTEDTLINNLQTTMNNLKTKLFAHSQMSSTFALSTSSDARIESFLQSPNTEIKFPPFTFNSESKSDRYIDSLYEQGDLEFSIAFDSLRAKLVSQAFHIPHLMKGIEIMKKHIDDGGDADISVPEFLRWVHYLKNEFAPRPRWLNDLYESIREHARLINYKFDQMEFWSALLRVTFKSDPDDEEYAEISGFSGTPLELQLCDLLDNLHESNKAIKARATTPLTASIPVIPSGQPIIFNPLSKSQIIEVLRQIKVDSGVFLRWSLANNVPVAIGTLNYRPHKTYDMGTTIYMNAGAAGNTWFGHADFQLANDSARKLIFGNFTIYGKTVVPFPQFIALYPNMFVRAHIAGGGHAFWDPLNDDDVDDYRSGVVKKDIFAVAVLANFDVEQTWYMDITGRFDNSLCLDDETQKVTDHPGAAVYARHWGWTHRMPSIPGMDRPSQPKFNTIVLQENQFLYSYNPGAGTREFSYEIPETGHWRGVVAPGMGAVIRGSVGMFKNTRSTRLTEISFAHRVSC